ncbi:MAG: hypothetical protein J3Q66DRAFT_350779 [Benniella sp.]|nr:MAG: hypothetical protein J3Q66DRAFT_350779 [Benniella sp.]
MFSIAELDELICRRLSHDDLARCAQVSKKWHSIVTPFLWNDLTWLEFVDPPQQHAFGRLVLEDYALEQDHELALNEHDASQDVQSVPSYSPSTLAKYGHWVRTLPDPFVIRQCFEFGDDQSPTLYDLMRHFNKRCPNFQVPHLPLDDRDFEADGYMDMIAECVLPRTRRLGIKCPFSAWCLETWRIKSLLRLCSGTLEGLAFDVNISSEGEHEMDPIQDEPETMPLLRRLNLTRCDGTPGTDAFWSWLWKRCAQMERLKLSEMEGITQSLVDGMVAYMSNLRRIDVDGYRMTDTAVAALLSGARHGWKEVCMRRFEGTVTCTYAALIKHCSTLESLEFYSCIGFTSAERVQLLASSPNLHTFIDLDDNMFSIVSLDAQSFIDQDSDTGLLKAWESESTLRTFEIKVRGIPRPDLDMGIHEAPVGQGREIQNQVYSRLARLTHLETLWLAQKIGFWESYDCLEMSLESGLHQLSGLKALKELNVLCLKTRIGVPEVQWMIEQWPRLRVIRGLEVAGRTTEVGKWLRQHYPQIQLL